MRAIEVPQFIKGLIFDCDGTLVDSMPPHMIAWEQVIVGHGGVWDYDYFFSKKGMPEETILSLYNRDFGMAFDPVTMVEEKHRRFHGRLSELKPIPHVVDVARRCYGRLPMAVASGGTRQNVELELEAIGVRSLFDIILTADDNIRPKPAPDLFLEAARQMGTPPEFCQVFEDADLGLEAARNAGMLATDVR